MQVTPERKYSWWKDAEDGDDDDEDDRKKWNRLSQGFSHINPFDWSGWKSKHERPTPPPQTTTTEKTTPIKKTTTVPATTARHSDWQKFKSNMRDIIRKVFKDAFTPKPPVKASTKPVATTYQPKRTRPLTPPTTTTTTEASSTNNPSTTTTSGTTTTTEKPTTATPTVTATEDMATTQAEVTTTAAAVPLCDGLFNIMSLRSDPKLEKLYMNHCLTDE